MNYKSLPFRSLDTSTKTDTNISKIHADLSLIKVESASDTKNTMQNILSILPNFPEFNKGAVRKSLSAAKSPKNDNPPPLGLFPINSNTKAKLHGLVRQPTFSRIGVPTIVVSLKEKSVQGPSPSNLSSALKQMEKNLSFKEAVASAQYEKEVEESPFFRKKAVAEKSLPPETNILLKKLRIGRLTLNNLSEADLVDLALEILQKPSEQRSPVDISVLTRSLASVDFFKKQDAKVTESCLKTMYHIPLTAGETVFSIGDIGTTFWVILRGSVSVHLHVQEIIGQDENGKDIIETNLREARTLQAGTAFGELALSEKKPRTATIICKQDCDFAVLDQGPFKDILKETMEKKLFADVNFLAALSLFKNWEFDEVKKLFYNSPIISYKRGAVVYEEGDYPDKMFIVKKGAFKVLKEIDIEDQEQIEDINKLRKSYRAKKIVELGILGEKEVFGEDELLNFSRRKHKVVCETLEAEVFEVNTKEFRVRILDSPESAEWLANHVLAKKKYYEERSKSIVSATHRHKNLWFFNKTTSLTKTATHSQAYLNNTLSQNSIVCQHEDGLHGLSPSPEIKTALKQSFYGESSKHIKGISMEDSELELMGLTKTRPELRSHQKPRPKGQTCPNSRSNSKSKESSPPPPLQLDLLRKAINELNFKSKKSNTINISPKTKKNWKFTSKEKEMFEDNIITGLIKTASMENFEEKGNFVGLNFERTKSKSRPNSPQHVAGSSTSSIDLKSANLIAKSREVSPTESPKHSLLEDRIKTAQTKDLLGKDKKQRRPVKYLHYSSSGVQKPGTGGIPIAVSLRSTRNEDMGRMMDQQTQTGWMSVKFDRSRDYTLDLEGIKEKPSSRLNFGAQRQKWKNFIQEKAGKDYKKMFYSREESMSMDKTEVIFEQNEGTPKVNDKEKAKEVKERYGGGSPRRRHLRSQTTFGVVSGTASPESFNFAVKGEKAK